MPRKDFDIESLARYLHITPAQVLRMADRGRLPGRKIAGQWRFSAAEIHHWLEERIGIGDENTLVRVEGVLRQEAGPAAPSVSVAQLLRPDAIAVPLAARTRQSVIRSMVDLAASTGLLWDPDKMADAVRAREELHPTALDNGVALLHPRRPMPSILAEAFLALGCTQQGIPFGGSHGSLTDIFFLICSTDDAGHLRLLARLSRLVADPSLLERIRHADNATQVHQAISQCEQQLVD